MNIVGLNKTLNKTDTFINSIKNDSLIISRNDLGTFKSVIGKLNNRDLNFSERLFYWMQLHQCFINGLQENTSRIIYNTNYKELKTLVQKDFPNHSPKFNNTILVNNNTINYTIGYHVEDKGKISTFQIK